MRFIGKMLAAAVVTASLCSAANAQGNRQPGAGGMMMGGGVMNVYSMVSTNKVLQDELKVTDEQKTKLADAMKPITEKRQEMMKDVNFRDMSDDDRKAMAEKMTKLTDEARKAVEGVLTSDQTKRASQINYQVMGMAAFSNKDVVAGLKLSDEQKEKIKGINEVYTKDAADLRKDMPRGRPGADQSDEDAKKAADARKKMTALRTEAEEKITATLTADQKTAWKDMTGEKFDTTKLMGGMQRPMRKDS